MTGVWRDVGAAFRSVLRDPMFAGIALMTLALGIGATAAVFGALDAVLLRPLPFPDPQELVSVEHTYAPRPPGTGKGAPDFTDWQAQHTVFQDLAVYAVGGLALVTDPEPVRVRATQATPNLFAALRVRPALGRTFLPAEGTPGQGAVVVLSDQLWRRAFGADPGVVGRSIVLNERSFLVVGVMPRGFTFLRQSELWIPYTVPRDATLDEMFKTGWRHSTVARLAPGLSVEQARTRLKVLVQGFRQERAGPADWDDPELVPLREVLVGNSQTPLLIVFGAALLMLLIACTNVAGLQLGRAGARQHEIATRLALGSGRGRIVRQLLHESGLVAIAGATLGLALAWVSGPVLGALVPVRMVGLSSVGLSGRMLGFALAVAVTTTLAFGLAPAIMLSRIDQNQVLKAGSYRLMNRGVRRMWSGLVVAQMALALVLLVAAGLLLQSLRNLWHVEPGFRRDSLATFSTVLPRAKYDSPASVAAFYREALARLRAIPGVQAASAVSILPLAPEGGAGAFGFQIAGRPPFSGPDRPLAELLRAAPDYFRTLGIPLLRGREFSEQDAADAEPVVIVSRGLADRFWPGQDPLGAYLQQPGRPEPRYRIVGVVADARTAALERPDERWQGHMYYPYQQMPARYMTFVLRSGVGLATLVAGARRAIAQIDPNVPIYEVHTMDDVVGLAIAPQRLTTRLLVLAGVLALVLAGVGTYGVIAHGVTQRTREIGIRAALGAEPSGVIRTVLAEGLRLAAPAIAIGAAGAWMLSRLLAHFLFQVAPVDARVFVAAPVCLALAALIACYLPARRAARMDPLKALRYE